jgi:mono/diheme cytochrome c family protein
MNSKITWVIALAVSVGIAIVAGSYFLVTDSGVAKTADPSDPLKVEVGKTVYAEHCAACHGANLEGQPNWRSYLPGGGLPAPPHDQSGHTWHHTDQLLFDYTKSGGAALVPEGFKSNMPAFRNSLSDDDIWAVLSYIKSTWPARIQRRQ